MNLPNESILENLHCLFHADDGALLSEICQLFINKIIKITQCFTELNQQIHFGKTKFMVINGEEIDKLPIVLNSGTIRYTQKQNYLGAIISDSGNISQDVRLQMKKIGPRMNIKLSNFCIKNKSCPFDIKLKVLDSCVQNSLLYICETWASNSIKCVCTRFRYAVKTILGIRTSVNSEIAYIKTGKLPLNAEISKRQYKFWTQLNILKQNNPASSITLKALLIADE